MKNKVTFYITLSEPIDPKKLREAWEQHERLSPGQPRVAFTRIDAHGLEAEAYDISPDWIHEFRRTLGEVLLKLDEFCTIREMLHVGEKL